MTVAELIEKQKKVPMLPITEGMCSTEDGDDKPPKQMFELAEECYSYDPESRPELSHVMKKIMDYAVFYTVKNSGTAELFWKSVNFFTYRNRVFLFQFTENMIQELVLRAPADKIDTFGKKKPREFIEKYRGKKYSVSSIAATLKSAINLPWSQLSIENYWFLCQWFPNFFHDLRAFVSMDIIVHAEWYCRNQDEANERMKKAEPEKAFVIRPSTTTPFTSPFTLCVGYDRYHIARTFSSSSIVFSSSLTGDNKFNTLVQLARYVKDMLHIPVAPRYNKYLY